MEGQWWFKIRCWPLLHASDYLATWTPWSCQLREGGAAPGQAELHEVINAPKLRKGSTGTGLPYWLYVFWTVFLSSLYEELSVLPTIPGSKP